MIVEKFSIEGLGVIVPDPHVDERGSFHRSFCERELLEHGIDFKVKQGNLSRNFKKHTMRGFHYQTSPTEEAKILSCVSGAIYNVVLDLRRHSKTFQKWKVIELTSNNATSIYVPAGCANAFLTLEDNTVVHYYMSEFFEPETYRGIRYNDPYFNVKWPCEPVVISERDTSFPDYRPT